MDRSIRWYAYMSVFLCLHIVQFSLLAGLIQPNGGPGNETAEILAIQVIAPLVHPLLELFPA